MDVKGAKSFEELSTDELKQGVELLVRPEELSERDVLIAILKTLEFTPGDVKHQIEEGEVLHAGTRLMLCC
jgi:hypothetical protein